VILVEGRTIRAVGSDVAIPAGAKVIDLSSMTVMPGLIDCHTHVCSGVVSRRGLPRKTSRGGQLSYDLGNTTAYRAIQGVANARSMLESGFTTIRDIGNAGNYADVDLRRAITEGLVPGPTMITAGRIIAPFGGQYAPERSRLRDESWNGRGSAPRNTSMLIHAMNSARPFVRTSSMAPR
jgi:imidazolonepropionase-like amidohydrolase